MPGPLVRIQTGITAYQQAQEHPLRTALHAAFPGRRRTLGQGDTADQVRAYYHEAQSYLTGPLGGACHFGYTSENQHFNFRTFNLREAQHAMEVQLGEALNLPPGSTVIDAGCGYGRVATTMASEYGLNVIGVDLMRERLDEAQRYVEEHGVADRVTLIEGSYSQLPLPDNSVDAIYTSETLVHADPLDATLQEFMRVLKPGGRLVHLEYSIKPLEKMNPVYRRFASRMIRNTGMTSIPRFTHGAFPEIFEGAGFEHVEVRDITHNVEPSWRWLFQEALRQNNFSILPKILRGTLTDIPNLAGSLTIWPYQRVHGALRYNIITATKPNINAASQSNELLLAS